MTTRHSPVKALKAQADKIASMLKAAERGKPINATFAAKIAAARGKPSLKFGVVMDDKVITVDMPWSTISETSEAGLSEFIVRQMREARDAIH